MLREISIGNIIFYLTLAAIFAIFVISVIETVLRHKRERLIIENQQDIQEYYARNNVGLDILEHAEEARDDFKDDSESNGEVCDRQQSGDSDRPGGRWQRNDGRSDR